MRGSAFFLGLFAIAALDASDWDLRAFGFSEASIRLDDSPAYARPDFDDSAWPVKAWHKVEERGIWWLRRRVELPREYLDNDVPVGLYISATAAAEVWWDGRPVGNNGRVGPDPAAEIPGPLDTVITLPGELLTPGEHVLAIRFSSQHAGSGIATPVDAVYFAPFGSPLRFFRDQYRPSLVLAGALGLAAVFLLVLWIRERQRDVAWLLLACASALVQLAFEVSRAFVQYPYPWHEWRLFAIGAAAAVGGVGLLGHLLTRFRLPGGRPLIAAVSGTAAILLLSPLPTGAATWLILLVWLTTGVAVCALAVRRGHATGWVGVIGLGAMLAAMFTSPDVFTDRTYFLGLVVLLLVIFADTVRNHARIRRERDQARHRLERLELELLKRQLRPHFLMNTLTTLNEWLETDPRTAGDMIDALAREFRLMNRVADQRLVALDEELALCRSHLAVMSYRQERDYRLEVQGDTRLEIPPATLHTLLENALTHSDRQSKHVRFDLAIRREADSVTLTLFCPAGAGHPAARAPEGTGLGYVRARLREAFGDAAAVESGPVPDGWATRIEMPLVANDSPRGSTAHALETQQQLVD